MNARLGRVLVVEDDPGIAAQLVRGLTRAGYETGSVTTGQAALDWPVPDVVLLDLGLPDIDGIEVCRRLRQSGDAAIIVVTARGEESDRVLALDEGADDYLIKPFGLAELLARIRAVLRRSQQPDHPHADHSQVLQHGTLTVDLRTHKVTVQGKQIAVTPKEFAILETLVSDPGRVVSRQEMLERAWDEHWYGPTKVLDVHMAALRRKLGDPGIIETVYGHGFRLADLGQLIVTRRILAMLLAFTALVLIGAVVPLTLNATAHDRNSFIQATAGDARAAAAIAQARLDGANDLPLSALITQTQQQGEGLLILSSKRTGSGYRQTALIPPINNGMPPGSWNQLAAEADTQGELASNEGQPPQAVTESLGPWVIAAMPVFNQGEQRGPVVGTVILARSTSSLNNEILALWVILGSIAAAAMIAAALLGFGLARWVSRPLKGLDAAARRLADGDLAIRAKVGSGPPELRRLGTTFNTMAGRLEALMHGHRAVIADVSHQLRTPLAALRLRLDLLAADTDPDTATELAGALDELARLSRLVDGLLTVARAENVVPVPTAVDVAAVARERVVAWHPVADDRTIVLAASQAPGEPGSGRGAARAPGAPVLAWIGEGHLEQILDNLIANALDALSPGHLVRLTAEATATGARITVRDDGPGMSPEDRERAFLRFTTSSPNGTGLGLAIVHRLAVSNGGTARLDETPGGGLTVTLDFPGVPKTGGSGSAGATATPAAATASM